jgi:hypothetical protein
VADGRGLTRGAVRALLDGAMRDAINAGEFEDFETTVRPRARAAEIAQETLQAGVESWLDDPEVPESVESAYRHAVDLSEGHQETDREFRRLLARYREIFFAMLSLAFSMILYGLLVNTEALGSTDGFGIPRPTFAGWAPSGDAARQVMFALTVAAAFIAMLLLHRYLQAGLGWLHGRFLVVAVDESRAPASGCSIDALVDHLREMEEETGLTLLDASPVWFRDPDDGEIRAASRPEFRRLAEAGEVDGDTRVFDLTAERLEEVRSGRWERRASASWHADFLPREERSSPANPA